MIRSRNVFVRLTLAFIFCLALFPVTAKTALSTNLTVSTTADGIDANPGNGICATSTGACTLRAAIQEANASAGADTIDLPSGTYKLTIPGGNNDMETGDLNISGDLIIQGPATGSVVIDANSLDRVFHVHSGNVTFTRLTITGGLATGGGGGIVNDYDATLTLNKSTIHGNRTEGGGGGIENIGVLTVINSTISFNITHSQGGGIENSGSRATLRIVNSTIANNRSSSQGGGVRNIGKTATYQNSIIAGNQDAADYTSGAGMLNGPTADCNAGNGLVSLGHNIVGIDTGCPSIATDILVTPASVFTRILGPLAANNGPTSTHALLFNSPAVDAANPAACAISTTVNNRDQRDYPRPLDGNGDGVKICDIGAYELDGLQTESPFIVTSPADPGDGYCTTLECTLREAIIAANNHPNDGTPDLITFDIPGGATISLTQPLPEISDPLSIDGGGIITIDGTGAGICANGLTVNAGNSTLTGLIIQNFCGSAIVLITNGNNLINHNTLINNGSGGTGAGVAVVSGNGNTIRENSIHTNGGPGIDLGADNATANDIGDADTGANGLQNAPALSGALPSLNAQSLLIQGRINSTPLTDLLIHFYANDTCDPTGYGEGAEYLGNTTVSTDLYGNAHFAPTLPEAVSTGKFVTATASGPSGTSEFSRCVPVGPTNDVWPRALHMNLDALGQANVSQFLDQMGQSRWYKFTVLPNSKVTINLTDLPANYDLTLYKDILAAYETDLSRTSNQDLVELNAEFASDAFSTDAYAPNAYAPNAYAPNAYAPNAYAPNAYAPNAYAPNAYAPNAYAPDAYAPDAYAPNAYAPNAYAPNAYAPDAYAPDAYAPNAYADAYASAQIRSLITASALPGTSNENITINTWNNTGNFYIRVRGRNGAFSLQQPYKINVNQQIGQCSLIDESALPASNLAISAGDYRTIILADTGRMSGDTSAMNTALAALAARSEVKGVIVDVNADARVAAANQLADELTNDHNSCPYAANLVAYSIKDLIDRYKVANPNLQYVVIVGNDHVIPFFRQPDQAGLANETDYLNQPFLIGDSPSYASLVMGYFMTQDIYGAGAEISLRSATLPVQTLSVGRLVETSDEIAGVVNAYLQTSNGIVTPRSALVTGYDFLTDAAGEVQANLEAGIGGPANSLITDSAIPPYSPLAWTADDMRAKVLGSRNDIMFLAGHFNDSGALAADFMTEMTTADVEASNVDLTNAIIFSAGCHSGYNTTDQDASFWTRQPDWAQTFARKRATLIAGTGYQYGDTEFIKYSEQIYVEFSKQLTLGTEPVAVGTALARAKQIYLADQTNGVSGIAAKSLLESTLFGLPMLRVDMIRSMPTTPPPAVNGLTSVTSKPGSMLGLQYADLNINPATTEKSFTLRNVDNPAETVIARYLEGKDGVSVNPTQPVLPRDDRNVGQNGVVLRGVGFRGGSYTDLHDFYVLTGAATTEIRGVHATFSAATFYPIVPWSTNYFAALANPASGVTTLRLTPAQYMADSQTSPTGTLRRFDSMNFRLFYSNNLDSYGTWTPGLSSPPSIDQVIGKPVGDTIELAVRATGDPSAGIQNVWATYSRVNTPWNTGTWSSIDLTMDPQDSTLWRATLPLNGVPYQDFRFVIQAVNGVGLVALDTNQGAFFIAGNNPSINVGTAPTSITLEATPTEGVYQNRADFSAVLKNVQTPLSNQKIVFRLGQQTKEATTDANGRATVNFTLLGVPGVSTINAAYDGTPSYAQSFAQRPFTILKQTTMLTISPLATTLPYGDKPVIKATLQDASGRALISRSVVFIVSNGITTYAYPATTDGQGDARLNPVPSQPGNYQIRAYFSGTIPLVSPPILDDSRYEPAASNTRTLEIVKRQLVITANNQIKQYSDPMPALTVTYSSFAPGEGPANLNGIQTCTTTATTSSPAGSYPITCSGQNAPNYTISYIGATLTVTQEDAYIEYSGDTNGTAGTPINLRVTVSDSAAARYAGIPTGPTPDTTIGTITNMWVAFDVYPSSTCASGTPLQTSYAQVSDSGTIGDGIGTASTTFTAATESTYCVVARMVAGTTGGVNQYYNALNAQMAVITFITSSPASAKSTTGGGYISINGNKNNFGFNARYSKTGAPQGQLVYISRGMYNGALVDFVVHSTSITKLTFVGSAYPLTAVIEGTGTLKINQASNGRELSTSSITFVATSVDSGSTPAGTGDTFAITIKQNGQIYSNTPATTLGGGNINIRLK